MAKGMGAAGAGVPRRGDLPSRPGDHRRRAPGGVGEAELSGDGGRRCGWSLVGTYYLRPNSLALGAHVANAGYVVADHCRRQGIGSRLCQHSLQAARRLGFRLMQFNLVVSTNTAGLRCWQRNGFQVVGTLPGAFHHRQLGYVDALVMIQSLMEEPVR